MFKTKALFLLAILILNFACKDTNQKTVVKSNEKPNIILLLTDDQVFTAVHALGNNEIITPNIDRLVKRGTSFSNAYNMGAWNGAVCVASRSMIISGRSVWNAKQVIEDWKSEKSTEKTWGKLMQEGGYDTYMTGKWHVEIDPKIVFDTIKDVKGGMASDYWDYKTISKYASEIDAGEMDLDSIMPLGYNRPKSVNDTAWRSYDPEMGGFWKGGRHWDLVLRDNAISFIETASKKDTPFFMYIASNAPHDPRQAPKKYLDMYPLENISLPKSWLPEYPYRNAIENGPTLRDEALAPFPRTPLAIKTHIREYYASITYLDEQIGLILDALEESGKMDNTYIFFTSDHGLTLGKHGLMGKQSLFESSVKPPLIIVGPGIPENKRVEAPVYMQDVMATSLELAKIEKPDYVFFNSLIDLAKGTQTESNYPAIYGSYLNVERSIHKGEYKLILYPNINKILLYNVKADPEEMDDLGEDPKYEDKVVSLFHDMVELQKTMDDPLDLTDWYNDVAK